MSEPVFQISKSQFGIIAGKNYGSNATIGSAETFGSLGAAKIEIKIGSALVDQYQAAFLSKVTCVGDSAEGIPSVGWR